MKQGSALEFRLNDVGWEYATQGFGKTAAAKALYDAGLLSGIRMAAGARATSARVWCCGSGRSRARSWRPILATDPMRAAILAARERWSATPCERFQMHNGSRCHREPKLLH